MLTALPQVATYGYAINLTLELFYNGHPELVSGYHPL
jgi:hypothetical protein